MLAYRIKRSYSKKPSNRVNNWRKSPYCIENTSWRRRSELAEKCPRLNKASANRLFKVYSSNKYNLRNITNSYNGICCKRSFPRKPKKKATVDDAHPLAEISDRNPLYTTFVTTLSFEIVMNMIGTVERSEFIQQIWGMQAAFIDAKYFRVNVSKDYTAIVISDNIGAFNSHTQDELYPLHISCKPWCSKCNMNSSDRCSTHSNWVIAPKTQSIVDDWVSKGWGVMLVADTKIIRPYLVDPSDNYNICGEIPSNSPHITIMDLACLTKNWDAYENTLLTWV